MSIVTWAGAVFPILVLFIAMSVFRMKTERAALLGIFCAVASSLIVGGSNFFIAGMDLAKGAFSALNILIVIWPAIFLYEMLNHADIFQVIKQMIQKKTKDQLILILLICWLFASFLQGITGFGVPVAVCAPLLIAVGVKPLWSVIITLLGHAWANTYGTLALAWDALLIQSETTQIFETKVLAGFLLWGVNIAGALIICWLYGKGKAVKHILPFVLIMSTVHGAGQLLVSFQNGTIAAFIPTTLALIAGWLLLQVGIYTKEWKLESQIMTDVVEKETEQTIGGGYAIFPFVLLAIVSVVVLLLPPVHDFLHGPVIALSFPEVTTGRGFFVAATDSYGAIHIFTHAGFVLLLTILGTYVVYINKKILKSEQLGSIGRATLKKIVPASLGILFLIMMSQVLKGSGMMEIIAQGVTQVTGDFYGAAVPFLGLLGAFVTSSNTSSNILLGSFQKAAADMLAANEAAILAAQTAGGAIGTVVGPSTILLGMTTAGCKGKEGEVLKFMMPIVLVEAALAGAVMFFLT